MKAENETNRLREGSVMRIEANHKFVNQAASPVNIESRKRPTVAGIRAATIIACIFAVSATAESWRYVSGFDGSGPPAIASHMDGSVYLAGVALTGDVAYSTLSDSNIWSLKSTIPGTPSVGMAGDTAP